jgi:hypothetical protein
VPYHVDHPEIPLSAERDAKADWNNLMALAQCVESDDPRVKPN